ncbi:hypothetical protein K8I85_04605 [bacterium]|nr:hypothetical protein [bacterium]
MENRPFILYYGGRVAGRFAAEHDAEVEASRLSYLTRKRGEIPPASMITREIAMGRVTIHDRLVASLERRGERVVPDARSSKYTTMTRDGGATGTFYFIGRAGALRTGRVVSKSHPVPTKLRDLLLEESPR